MKTIVIKPFSNALILVVSTFFSTHTFAYNNRQVECLALSWGADACGQAVDQYAEKKMNSDVNDIIASPICSALIANSLKAGFSENDLKIALMTGALDQGGESGIESDNIFYNLLGGISYALSFTLKASVYNKCINSTYH
jgi:hypothetical protein